MNKAKKISTVSIVLIVVFLSTPIIAQTVYVTKTGSKYHKSSCRYLKSSKISINLADAKAKDFTACSVCKPSSTVSSTGRKRDTTTVKDAPKTTKTAKPVAIPTTSKRCSAITQKGTQCKRTTKSPNGKCWQHGGD